MRATALLSPLPSLFLAAALALSSAAAPPALAAGFDGNWQVTVKSEYGDCDHRFTIPVEVRSGAVRYTGRYASTAKGRVRDDGHVRLTFRHEAQVVEASGTLRPSFGNGGWKSATLKCSGTWIARRAR
ncbi:hypothetical protein [Afifella sp. IM 167]|uniref:hypothetical protein n=1 Tax=Afifella sp. IM 167 TaxID=2033586 RepID=UPI001CC9854A|nr:hypothetical protein [Afifella sp. IM 167]MBZ8133814.1 hypothetical protein [Afifella sp. IM 167]